MSIVYLRCIYLVCTKPNPVACLDVCCASSTSSSRCCFQHAPRRSGFLACWRIMFWIPLANNRCCCFFAPGLCSYHVEEETVPPGKFYNGIHIVALVWPSFDKIR